MRLRAGALFLAIALAGCGGSPSPEATETALPTLAQVVLLESVVPRWGSGPDNELLDDWGENTTTLDAGRRAVVLSAPAPGPGGTWVRVWVVPDPSVYPGDFFAWLPVSREGRPVLRPEPAPECPRVPTIAAVASLVQPDRLRCFGAAPITLEAKSWLPGRTSLYDVDPTWYGTNADNSMSASLYDPAAEFRPPAPTTPWVDARTPPGVAVPPPDFLLKVSGQFDHPSAAGCRRWLNRAGWNPAPPPGAGVPIEAVEDSVRWCREQFVVAGWDIVEGPEGRPFDARNPQLHRVPAPPPGVPVACGGVGMPPLHVRIDPSQVDPVWIETGQHRSLVFFGPEFRLDLGPPPRIVGPGGLELVDGDIVDPDRGRPGLSVCPGGEVVSFTVGPGLEG